MSLAFPRSAAVLCDSGFQEPLCLQKHLSMDAKQDPSDGMDCVGRSADAATQVCLNSSRQIQK